MMNGDKRLGAEAEAALINRIWREEQGINYGARAELVIPGCSIWGVRSDTVVLIPKN